MRAFLLVVFLAGCAETGASKAVSPEATVSAPAFVRSGAPEASAAPTATASAAPVASAPTAAPSPSPPKAPEPLPDVEVRNVGMHIGGGPNDNNTKRPIRDAVKPHFDAMRACYAKAVSPRKAETFGVDIRIPADGGVAKISKPRTAMKGDGLVDCMVAAFEKVEFKEPPKHAPMTVSFSVEFTKK